MTEKMTVEKLQAALDDLDDGVLRKGSHKPGGKFCALEFESQVRGRKWSDQPITLPDIRALNDGFGSDNVARTKALLPVMVALWDWQNWSRTRKRRWINQVVMETVKQIISKVPKLPEVVREKCRKVKTVSDAATAANAAAGAATAGAADAAGAAAAGAADAARAAAAGAADAARAASAAAAAAFAAAAARAAVRATRNTVLQIACQIWINAAINPA